VPFASRTHTLTHTHSHAHARAHTHPSHTQLLLHPIVHSLDASPFAWLHEMLKAFNSGDMHKYDELCVAHGKELNSQPALVRAAVLLPNRM